MTVPRHRYRHVAVALDGSEHALRALPVAQGVARVLDADLWLVSVGESPEATDRFAEARSRVGSSITREVLLDGEEDDAGPALGRFDDEHPEVLVCMSTRGRRPTARAVLGSVARAVVEHSSEAVLVVGPACVTEQPEISGTLIVCLDGTPDGDAVLLPWVKHWARWTGLPIGPMRVTYPLPAPEARIPPTAAQMAELSYGPNVARQLESEGHRVVDLSHAAPDPAEAIVRTAAKFPGSIAIMASADRHPTADAFVGSTVATVLRRSPVPLLLISRNP